MVALDCGAGDREGFDAVGIDGALCEPFDVFDLVGFFVKHVDEPLAYDLAFALGVGHACQLLEKFSRRIHADYIQSETFVIVHHVCELVFTQHSMVHENAGQIGSDGFVEQHGGNR